MPLFRRAFNVVLIGEIFGEHGQLEGAWTIGDGHPHAHIAKPIFNAKASGVRRQTVSRLRINVGPGREAGRDLSIPGVSQLMLIVGRDRGLEAGCFG